MSYHGASVLGIDPWSVPLCAGGGVAVLFDAGGTASILFANVAKLGVHLPAVDEVVISHDHGDHIAALSPILRTNHEVTVWLPYSASTATKTLVERSGAALRQEKEAAAVCQNGWTKNRLPAGSAPMALSPLPPETEVLESA